MCSYTVLNTMATIYIICFGFEKKNLYFVNTQCVYISYDYHNIQTIFYLQHEHGMVSEIS